jgi:hypothetical protein
MLSKLFGLARTWRRTSAARKASSPASARPALEELGARLVPSVLLSTYNDSANHAVAYVIRFYGTGNSVTIDHVGNYLQVSAPAGTSLWGDAYAPSNGNTQWYWDASYGEIWVTGGTGGNNIAINGTVKQLVVQSDAYPGSPADAVTLGNGTLQNIQASVTLLDRFGSLGVTVSDQNDTASRTAVLGGSSMQSDPITPYNASSNTPAWAPCGSILGLTPAPIYYQTGNASSQAPIVTNLSLVLGQLTSTVDVLDTYAKNTTVVNQGPANVFVGNGSTQGIQGTLTVQGAGTVVAQDQADTTDRTVTVTPSAIIGLAPSAIQLSGVGAAVVYGNARDTAYLYDGAGSNTLIGTPTYAYLKGSGYLDEVVGFKAAVGEASAGSTDTAYLYDAAGSNTFIGTPSYAYLTGSGYLSEAVGFKAVVGEASAGSTDTAYLYDGAGSNTLVGTAGYAYLSGSGFLTEAVGFKVVVGEAVSGGSDVAYLYAGAGANTFVGAPTYAYMAGSGFLNEAVGFRTVVGEATPGGYYDAYLYGSTAGDDAFVNAGSYAYDYGTGYFNEVVGFRSVAHA